MSDPGLPEKVQDLATACGFQVRGWNTDEEDAIVQGPDVEYLGSREECIAYMTAWQQCQTIKLRAELAEDGDPANKKVKVGIIGLQSSGQVRPGAPVTIVARPQVVAFRGSRIVVPDHLAPSFTIEDIRVGNRSQLLQPGSIPAEAFAARLPYSLSTFLETVQDNRIVGLQMTKPALAEFGRPMSFETCQTSQDLVVIATNISGELQYFRAWVVGKYAGY